MLQKLITSSLLFLIAIGGFFVHSVSYANNVGYYNTPGAIPWQTTTASTTSTKESQSETVSKWLNEAALAVNAILWVVTVIISPVIIFAGWLMSPDWTSGDLFGLREPMHKMWIIVSNIIYFIYAILLIMIALATIFGKENFNYKSMLPKLALGILMVPFTWWFVQWTISLSAVVTASVINIPTDTMREQYSNGEDNGYLTKTFIPRRYVVTNTTNKDITTKCRSDTDTTNCISMNEILNNNGWTYNTLLVYAYHVFKLQDYKELTSTNNPVTTLSQLINNGLVWAIMLLVFWLLVMALIAMLLLRAIKLWMYAIFSPLFTLHFVAGKELFGKSTEWFDMKEFIGLCFVPAVVWLTLSFGLMIVSIIQMPPPNTPGNPSCTPTIMRTLNLETTPVSGWCTIGQLMWSNSNKIVRWIETIQWKDVIIDVVSIAGVSIIFRGLSTNVSDAASLASSSTSALSAAGGIFGTLITNIIALIFIWMAFMAAKWVSKAVEAAIKPFEDMGNKVGNMAMSAPKYVPIPGTGGQSAASLQRAADLSINAINEKKLQASTEKAGKLLPDWMNKWIIAAEDRTAITEAVKQWATQWFDDTIKTMWGVTWKVMDKWATYRGDNFEVVSWAWKDAFAWKKDDIGRIEGKLKGEYRIDGKELSALMKMIKWESMDKVEQEIAWNVIKEKFGSSNKESTTGWAKSEDTNSFNTGTGNWKVTLNGVTFNLNGVKDFEEKNYESISLQISKEIKAKSTLMKSPTQDELKKLLDNIGANTDAQEWISAMIIKEIKDTKFKESE